MEKRWVLREQGNAEKIDQLAGELNIEHVLANLLVQRDIDSFDKSKSFFRPSLEDLYDPFLMKDMNIAIDRIGTAMSRNEKILVYGDYDVDGTTSVALMYSFLAQFYTNLGYYIPDRYEEGYGISIKGIDYAHENNYTLVIALDCGIKAVEKVKYAKGKKIDFIICDHHRPGSELPPAMAVLDPQRTDCSYPFKELSGCGVGFKLIQAYARINSIPFESILPFLDLVAVSIASDIVPLTDENRVMAYFGLQQLNKHPRMGLHSIMRTAGMENKVLSIEDIVFRIGPRINAAGRIESGAKAVELLVATDTRMADAISEKINAYNNTRKNIDRSITQEAMQMISSSSLKRNANSTVLFSPQWHKGVIGIVASRLIETYYRPTIVLTESNGFITGSARSVNGFDLYNAIDACSDLLENFGGHMYAAGLTLKPENLEAFAKRFDDVVKNTITSEQKIPVVDIDAEISFSMIDDKLVRILNQFKPFGPGNMAPVFMSRMVKDVGTGRIVGNTGEHLKLDLVQEGQNRAPIGAIAFQMSNYYEIIRNGNPFDICYTIEENEFRGITTLQLMVKDIKMAGD